MRSITGNFSVEDSNFPGVYVRTGGFRGTIDHPRFCADHERRRAAAMAADEDRRWDDHMPLDGEAMGLIAELTK